MEQIRLTNDTARNYGYNRLTGEACQLSMRALYELTKEAMQTFLSYTGIHSDPENNRSNWNDRQKYSCMIDNEAIKNLIIIETLKRYPAAITAHPNHCKEIVLMAGTQEELNTFIKEECSQYDLNDHGEIVEIKHGYYKLERMYYPAGPHRNFNSIHAATGQSA